MEKYEKYIYALALTVIVFLLGKYLGELAVLMFITLLILN